MEVICYACGRGEFPENTLEAIQNCQSINPEWRIEMDLQLTKDRQIILFHDEHTDRTTGHQSLIADLNLEELQQLNAGYNFEKDGAFPFREAKIQVPTLRQVFETYPVIKVLLDVHTADLAAVPLIIDLVEDYDMANQVVIVSKYDDMVDAFKASKPDWNYGAATVEVKKLIYSSFLRLDALFALKSDILMISVKFGKMTVLTPRIIRHAKKGNKKIWAWMEEGERVKTVENKAEVSVLEELGATGFFTEYPKAIKGLWTSDERP
ncbi:MAG: hypothetical protein HEP71_10365 [Roseivirga sp.]|nr:hypothetical protein [Roseivirga sp.]